jgi:outer membrane protein assembly factor BamB
MNSLFIGLAVVVTADPVPTWTQWRGPSRDGIVVSKEAWPKSLQGDSLKLTWKTPELGPSYSGPLVLADRVITTETADGKREVVSAWDRKTGKLLWRSEWDGAVSVPFFAARNGSWIRATPVADTDTVYVAGMRDVLVALDVQTGKERWRLDFMAKLKTPAPDFGFVCSPLVDDSGVYVQAGGAFQKVDKKTGKILWTTLKDGGGMMGSAFSSPVFATLAGRDQVVVQTRTELAGVDRANGSVLWKRTVPSFRGMNILTPVTVGDDGVFTSTYGGSTQLFRVKSAGGNYETENGWSFKYEGNMTTPVIVNEHAYFLGKDRRAICVNLTTGKETWRSEKTFGDYWNLVANGDTILALDNRGILFLLKANPNELEIIDQRKVADSETWAHLAVCGDEIVIRDLKHVAMWKWKNAGRE